MVGVSVIICTYNGISRLTKTIKSVLAQKTAVPYELIIVNNASTDDTNRLCYEILDHAEVKIRWRVVYEGKQGLNSARMAGLQTSTFNILLFCDDDNELNEDYIQKGYENITANEKIGVLGGNGFPVFKEPPPDWFDSHSHSYAVGVQYKLRGKIDKMPASVYGAGAFFRKAVLKKIFDSGFTSLLTDRKGNALCSGGDVEWCYLLQVAGYEVWHDEELKFGHHIPPSRLTVSYYKNLKQAIADGSAKLQSYMSFFRRKNPNLFHFLTDYFYQMLKYHLLFFKYQYLKRSMSQEIEIGRAILNSRAVAYRRDFLATMSHFKMLKKISRSVNGL